MNAEPAQRLAVYLDETEKHHGLPVYEKIVRILANHGVAGVTVIRGIAGYGSHRVFHTAKILELSTTLPVVVIAVDSREKIGTVLPEISEVVSKGLIEVSDTQIIRR